MNGTPVRPEPGHERVGVPGRGRAAEGELDPRPLDPGVGQRGTRRVRTLIESRQRVAAERVHPGADDRNIRQLDPLRPGGNISAECSQTMSSYCRAGLGSVGPRPW